MYTEILIPTDGSELSGKAVDHGIALAKRIGAKVTVLTVLPDFHTFTTDTQMIEDTPAQYKTRMQQRAEKILGAVIHTAQAAGVACEGVHVENGVLTGRLSIPRYRKAVTLSSWLRTAATAFPRSSSAARRSRCSRIPRSQYSSIAERRGDSIGVIRPMDEALAAHERPPLSSPVPDPPGSRRPDVDRQVARQGLCRNRHEGH